MATEDRENRFEEEIAEIENREGKRNLFLVLGGIVVVFLVVIVIMGARERARQAEIAARPGTEPVELGEHVGTVANTALFSVGDSVLYYVEGIGDAEITSETAFARPISYTEAGVPDTVPPGVTHWRLAQTDTLPYTVEWVTEPLIGVTPTDYRELALGSLRPEDYGSGGQMDWRPLEQGDERVRVTGRAVREDASVYLREDSVQVRLQAVQGLTAVDSLELAWATESRAPLTGYGRISRTPRGERAEIPTLFVLQVNAVHPPLPEAVEIAPATGADTAPADTAGPEATVP